MANVLDYVPLYQTRPDGAWIVCRICGKILSRHYRFVHVERFHAAEIREGRAVMLTVHGGQRLFVRRVGR